MDNRIGFSDSNDMSGSGSSTISCIATTESISPDPSEISAIKRLSENLESIFQSSGDFDSYADAKISVPDGREVPVHRCILSARSSFFKSVFSGKERGVKLELKELAKNFDISFDSLVTVLAYVYSGKVKEIPKGVCICVDADCEHVACRPVVDFMLEVLYASFTFEITELVALCQVKCLRCSA